MTRLKIKFLDVEAEIEDEDASIFEKLNSLLEVALNHRSKIESTPANEKKSSMSNPIARIVTGPPLTAVNKIFRLIVSPQN